ncbi:hypothetical protein [Bradyrhizobium sp. CCBAU 11361]|uniref:hypothetical protein n=1 Tax=Bradyrhizobium sp. CCBAU 11361 TaxID=1630812 RepID=UPI00230609FD|nr:hypothetical protein [Bradyrhizobium sp. CCBAU 11361]MDA9492405.1 hypothetical protein [Bradyrhizobium sp. CCBAU 11361]
MNIVPFNSGLMNLTIKAQSGVVYDVDLSEFWIGGKLENVSSNAKHVWSGDFVGRPLFAIEIAELLRIERLEPEASKQTRHAFRSVFRFFDAIEAKHGIPITSIADVTDAHGPMMLEWIAAGNSLPYRRAKGGLDALRRVRGLPPLFWPARAADPLSAAEPIDKDAVRHLFNALKHEARCIKQMFAEGERLAAAGRDPRTDTRVSAQWTLPENRAWIIKELTQERLLDKRELKNVGAYWGMVQGDRFGPDYLAPGMGERGREGVVGNLRWFYPSYQDTAVFLWLFLLGTGWNLSTALGIDVSEDDAWCQAHPHSEQFTVIHAFKARAHRHQFTLSMLKPEWHPYRIIQYMIRQTSVLRATVHHKLELARRDNALSPSVAKSGKIVELEALVRSPWLYHTVNKIGEVSAFNSTDSAQLGEIARTVVTAHGLVTRYPSLEKITTSDARDAWIGYAYVQSGYHVLLTQLASQHANARTLKHYLKSRRYRAYSEGQVRNVQDAAFAEISAGRVVDPTRLRVLVANGTITSEQEQRLQDFRQRTRLGLGCLDPTNPPRRVAPDHKAGALCRVQRCTGCQHGVVFKESLGPLARACAELIHIQRTIPYIAWSGSSLEDELASIEETLKGFDQAEVAVAIQEWSHKLQTGEVRAHDTYPIY